MPLNISRGGRFEVAIIAMAACLDVASTQFGVLILGNGEAGPFARATIAEFGKSWWVIYLPYEIVALLVAFFLVRAVRRRAMRSTDSPLLSLPLEYFVPAVTIITVLNNLILILSKLPPR